MSTRRLKQAVVSFNPSGEPMIVEATYIDEMPDPVKPERMLGAQENNREHFEVLPKKEQRLTKQWLDKCILPMLERQDPQGA